MLSIGKMVAGAEDYYLGTVAQGKEEYYTGTGEAPGNWMGSGTEALGLRGKVAPDDLRAILAGVSPEDGCPLAARRGGSSRVSGFDLTFSAPKSVSVLWGLSDPETSAAVRAAHDRAVGEGLAYLERHATMARRGAGGERRIETSGLVAAAFVHRTSRNGDPQLHTHVLAANAVLGADGRWSSPDARLLYFHARTAGFVYQASLRANLVETLGVRFGPVVRGSAELIGADPTLLRRFSTRGAEIEEYLSVRGQSSGRTAELAALATRAPKPSNDAIGDAVDLRALWRGQALAVGIDPDADVATVGRPRAVVISAAAANGLIARLVSAEGLTAQESVFERRDLVRAIAESMPDGAHLDALEDMADRVLAAPGMVELDGRGRGGEGLQTTRELLEVEASLLEVAGRREKGPGRVQSGLVTRMLDDHQHLSVEQASMVRRLASSGAGVEVVVGKAGTGKTTALAVTREIFESAGYVVSGTAVSARAAEGLEISAGIPSVTLARLLGELDDATRVLGPRHVLVVDEAGMVGTRTIGRLIDATAASGSLLILTGDPRQLAEINAGGTFRALANRLGAIELNENRRQHEQWERQALDELRSGDVAKGLLAYDVHDRIRISATMVAAQTDLVERWLEANVSGALMLAVNRRDVDELNALARTKLLEGGMLGDEVLRTEERSFALSDEVVCLRNAKKLGVLNGTRGTVVGFDADGLHIETSAGPRVLPTGYVEAGHLTHGYATTVHKAQGATYDRAFVLATDSLTREAGYVAMSRARSGTELFVISGAFEDGRGPDMGEDEPLARTAARLATSQAKFMASEHMVGGLPTDRLRPSDFPTARHRPSNFPSDFPMGPGAGSPSAAQVETAPAAVSRSPIDLRARFADIESPEHHVAALGPRPASVNRQRRYDRVARNIDAYRECLDVNGPDPLGPRPFETFPRLAYDEVVNQIQDYEKMSWRELNRQSPGIETRDLGGQEIVGIDIGLDL
jgi:conjugative relaxase-like TrwC/TraI family protein